MVLSELAERIDPEKLAAVARAAPVPWAQRLGFLLEHLGFAAKVPALKEGPTADLGDKVHAAAMI